MFNAARGQNTLSFVRKKLHRLLEIAREHDEEIGQIFQVA
jgi:hypothetical protein